jgi:hypothetical protein
MRTAFLLAIATNAFLAACDSRPHYQRWALPNFTFTDIPDWGTIQIIGSMKGPNLAYPVNTWKIFCTKQQMSCRTADVEQIGDGQLGEIWVDDWTVTSWTDTAVAVDQGEPTSCAHHIMIINRIAKTVSYTSTPQNQDKNYCQGYNKFAGPASNNKWEIGQPVQPWEHSPGSK